tara:strand:- start:304 stop:840 length:537 start_codon:yes stop_codon:yes gene_type:complete
MKNLNEFMTESLTYAEKQELIPKYQDLYEESIQRLISSVQNIFPNGKINAKVYSGIGDPTLSISFYLINNKADQSSGIVDNDPVVTKFIAHLPKVSEPSKDVKFKLELLMGGLSLEPEEGSYMAMSRLRLPFRKSNATIDKQVDKLIKYFKNVGQTILDNKEKLYKKDILDKYLDINV